MDIVLNFSHAPTWHTLKVKRIRHHSLMTELPASLARHTRRSSLSLSSLLVGRDGHGLLTLALGTSRSSSPSVIQRIIKVYNKHCHLACVASETHNFYPESGASVGVPCRAVPNTSQATTLTTTGRSWTYFSTMWWGWCAVLETIAAESRDLNVMAVVWISIADLSPPNNFVTTFSFLDQSRPISPAPSFYIQLSHTLAQDNSRQVQGKWLGDFAIQALRGEPHTKKHTHYW